jgi:hypothetical protein
MRTILGIIVSSMLASQALAALVTVSPNGGDSAGSLSVINVASGKVEHNLRITEAFHDRLHLRSLARRTSAAAATGFSGAPPGRTSRAETRS